MANIKEALKVIEDVITAAHKAVQDLRTQQAAAEGQGVGELVAVFTAALDAHLNTAMTIRAAYEGLIAASDMTRISDANPEVVKSTIALIAARETSMTQSAQKLEAAQKAVVALQTKAAGTAKDAKDTLNKLLPAAPTPPSGGNDGGKPTTPPPAPKGDGKPAPAGDKPAGDKPTTPPPAPQGDGKPAEQPKKRGFFGS